LIRRPALRTLSNSLDLARKNPGKGKSHPYWEALSPLFRGEKFTGGKHLLGKKVPWTSLQREGRLKIEIRITMRERIVSRTLRTLRGLPLWRRKGESRGCRRGRERNDRSGGLLSIETAWREEEKLGG